MHRLENSRYNYKQKFIYCLINIKILLKLAERSIKSKLIVMVVMSSTLLFISLGSMIISAMSITMWLTMVTMMTLRTWIRLHCLLLPLLILLILLSLFSCTLSFSISSISCLFLLILLSLFSTWFACALSLGRSRISMIFVISFRIILSFGCFLILCLLIGFWDCILFVGCWLNCWNRLLLYNIRFLLFWRSCLRLLRYLFIDNYCRLLYNLFLMDFLFWWFFIYLSFGWLLYYFYLLFYYFVSYWRLNCIFFLFSNFRWLLFVLFKFLLCFCLNRYFTLCLCFNLSYNFILDFIIWDLWSSVLGLFCWL